MIRLLLGGTALTAVLITGALAQSSSLAADTSAMSSASQGSATSSSALMDSSTMSSQMSTASSMESSMMSSAPAASSTTTTTTGRTQVNILSGYTQADTDHLASKIIGSPVYDGTGDKANNLGKITDFIVNENGGIAAVIVGVGGFLGIGEKQVAVDFGALQWTVASDNTHRFVLQTTKDQLTSAPDFKTVDASSAAASGSTAPASSSTSMDLAVSSSAQQ